MRALSFEHYGRQTYGIHSADGIHEANAVYRAQFPDLRALIAAGLLQQLASNCVREALAEDAVTFLPTIPRPSRILCVGVNYRPHVEEMGREIPDRPVLFARFPGSLVGHGQPLVRPQASEQFDFEGELAIVIGRRARHVTAADVAGCIAGYTAFMDGSVRDWQRHTPQFTAGKNFESSGAMGPYLVTPDEAGPLAGLPIETRVNGEIMQQARLSDLIFDVPALLAYCSTFAELLPGDVIATGTPGGVGAARTPPRWLVAGDRVEVRIGKVGSLSNPVRDE